MWSVQRALPAECRYATTNLPGGLLPLGLMLNGARLNDALVLRAAHAYQSATDWHARRAPLG